METVLLESPAMNVPRLTLLRPTDPPPARIARPDGASPLVMVCDHAGLAVPAVLGDLGITAADLRRHIGFDIGTAGLGDALGALLDATTITQSYSRLVIDCNRPPGHATSVAVISDGTVIPANRGLRASDIAAREDEIFHPYQDLIAATLDARAVAGRPSVLLSLHSFTPVFQGSARACHIGLLYDRDPRLARALGGLLGCEAGLVIADNEPYALDQVTDYTVPRHGEQRGLVCLELEIRQDLIADAAGQQHMAALLARHLPAALHAVAAVGAA